MADNLKSGRKDRGGVREVAQEIVDVNQDRLPPKYENPNRDRARGDWDRSGKHNDEAGDVGP